MKFNDIDPNKSLLELDESFAKMRLEDGISNIKTFNKI